MITVADVAVRLRADATALVNDARAAGKKAGDEFGGRFTESSQRQMLKLGSIVTAGLAAGLTQLDTAARQYQATVGATSAETERAKAAALALFKVNTAGFDEILGLMAKLRTDQGLTEEQTNRLAQSYLTWAKVAGGDAPTAVKNFDDVLDAFGLKATDAAGIMDKLVASNQQYGGSLQQRVQDLHALAPVLQGLNLTVNDGIALENLFAASGLDASNAQQALKLAVQKLKPGQGIDDLIKQVSSIVDPTERAKKAMELFGARGGIALAQAFKPGITSLSDFGVAEDQASGKAKAAGDAIDGSIPKQFELFVKNIGGTLLDLAGPAGPVLLTVASIGQLAAAFDGLKLAAVAGWLATLGPVAIAGGAAAAFIGAIALGVEAVKGLADGENAAAAAAGDLTGAQAKLKAQAAATGVAVADLDGPLKTITDQQYLQAANAALAAGATNEQADAAGKAAVANDRGADAIKTNTTATATNTAETTTNTGATTNNTAATGGNTAAVDANARSTANDSYAKTELTGAALIAADAANTHRLRLLGEDGAQRQAAAGANILAASLFGLGQAYDDTARRRASFLGGQNADPQIQKLRGLGEGPGFGGQFVGPTVAPSSTVYSPVPLPKIPKGSGGGGGGISQAAKDDAAAIKANYTTAYNATKAAGEAFYDQMHAKILAQISATRDAATKEIGIERDKVNAWLSEEKRKNAEPVTAAEKALADLQNQHRERDLIEARDAANQGSQDASGAWITDPIAQRNAQEALNDFYAQQKIDALKAVQATADATAEAQAKSDNDKLDQRQAAADKTAKQDAANEDKAAAKRKKDFDTQLADWNRLHVETKKGHETAIAALNALWAKFGLDAKGHGAKFGTELAAGLASELKDVEKSAESLASAVRKYIKVGSPAESGPLHDDPPDVMGEKVGREWTGGVIKGISDADLALLGEKISGVTDKLKPDAPQYDPRFNADGTPAGHYVTGAYGSQTWVPNPVAAATPAATTYAASNMSGATAWQAQGRTDYPGAYGVGPNGPLYDYYGNYAGAGATLPNGQPNPDYRGGTAIGAIHVHNPAPEPASTSVRRSLQRVAAWGYGDS